MTDSLGLWEGKGDSVSFGIRPQRSANLSLVKRATVRTGFGPTPFCRPTLTPFDAVTQSFLSASSSLIGFSCRVAAEQLSLLCDDALLVIGYAMSCDV